jgi:GAF domain-containing protein
MQVSALGKHNKKHRNAWSSFSTHDEEMLILIAAQIAIALAKSNLHRREMTLHKQNETFLRISKEILLQLQVLAVSITPWHTLAHPGTHIHSFIHSGQITLPWIAKIIHLYHLTALPLSTLPLPPPLQLDTLISNMMSAARDLLEVDIATLFLVDRYSRTLWKLNTGAGQEIIRMPMTAGLAGFVATTGQTVNIPDVYQDERFNQKFDKQTGYRTRSMLCMPVFDRNNQVPCD